MSFAWPDLVINLVLAGVLALSTAADLRWRRIPNALTFPAFGAGILLNGVFFGGEGLFSSASGGALGLGMLLPLFFLRGMGAGDVKLMAAIGALKGPEFVFFTCAWASIFGGGMALFGLIRSRKLGVALAHLYFFKFLPRPDGSFISAGRIPYAPAIAMGALLTLEGVRWIGG